MFMSNLFFFLMSCKVIGKCKKYKHFGNAFYCNWLFKRNFGKKRVVITPCKELEGKDQFLRITN